MGEFTKAATTKMDVKISQNKQTVQTTSVFYIFRDSQISKSLKWYKAQDFGQNRNLETKLYWLPIDETHTTENRQMALKYACHELKYNLIEI